VKSTGLSLIQESCRKMGQEVVEEMAAFPHRQYEFWNLNLKSASTLGTLPCLSRWGTFVILSTRPTPVMIEHFEMNLVKIIKELSREKEQLDRVIASLEALQAATEMRAVIRSRRGRKSMGAEERREVSARMKRYWAAKRN
jgi:hypothetical protein